MMVSFLALGALVFGFYTVTSSRKIEFESVASESGISTGGIDEDLRERQEFDKTPVENDEVPPSASVPRIIKPILTGENACSPKRTSTGNT